MANRAHITQHEQSSFYGGQPVGAKTHLRAHLGLQGHLLHKRDGRGLTGSGSQDGFGNEVARMRSPDRVRGAVALDGKYKQHIPSSPLLQSESICSPVSVSPMSVPHVFSSAHTVARALSLMVSAAVSKKNALAISSSLCSRVCLGCVAHCVRTIIHTSRVEKYDSLVELPTTNWNS